MNTLINAMRTGDSLTENGMVTNSSSLNECIDLFASIGAVRPQMKIEEGRKELISKFEAAYVKDALLTRKMLFWARDIRGGAGEREAFRVLLKHACQRFPNNVIDNIHLIAEFGRWDDVFVTFGTPVEDAAIQLIIKNLREGNSLLCKWMPRTGGKVSSEKKVIANKVRNAMGMSPKEFRKLLVQNTQVVETKMCAKQFDSIKYQNVPSVAMARYTNAFNKNDANGFGHYKAALVKGEVTINAGAIYPYDILKTLGNGDEILANEQWKALPNYMEGSVERVMPVCDVSGSMNTPVSGSTTAMEVCISLGLYISERNVGPFQNAFITFSERPELQYLDGDLISRYNQLRDADWGMSTDLEATFSMILDSAIRNKISEDQMPTCILIMSDMQFNAACDGSSALQMIRTQYEMAGYLMPKIVFWNLNARGKNTPAQISDVNTSLVSGFSPSILKTVLSGGLMDPERIMLNTLNTERYEVIQ